MRKLMIGALLAGQLVTAAQPVLAAELTEARSQQTGAFAGLRLRVPLDGHAEQRRIRAGLAVAPTLHTQTAGGETRLQMGEGVELGLVGREPVQLSIAGTPVSRLAQGGTGPNGERLGVSTLGWVAIGVGTLIVVLVGAMTLCMSDNECNPSE